MARLSDLTTLDEFRQVEQLEGVIWGPVDLVPVPILAVQTPRTVTIGSNTTAWTLPFNTTFHDAHVQSIYPASEAGPAGRIQPLPDSAPWMACRPASRSVANQGRAAWTACDSA